MQKSARDLISQTVDRLMQHYRLLDTLDPTEVEAGNLLEELGDLRGEFLEHEVAVIRTHSCDSAAEEEGAEQAYSRRIAELRPGAADNPAIRLALDIHGAKSVLCNLPMPSSLRSYIADRLVDEVRPSKPANRRKVFPFRDLLIVDIIEDLVKHEGLKAYGSSAEGFEGSACWVVAEAQRQLGRTPNSPRTVAKILLKVRKAEKAELRAASLATGR